MTPADWKESLWSQLGASIDMLENAIVACPDTVWHAGSPPRAFWYVTYHTLFFLDLYTFGKVEGFAPPEPFSLDELDPAGVYPEQAPSRDVSREYLEACRERIRTAIHTLTDEGFARRCDFSWAPFTYGELLFVTMRHVQHHTAQLQWTLREKTDSVPAWVGKARRPLGGD